MAAPKRVHDRRLLRLLRPRGRRTGRRRRTRLGGRSTRNRLDNRRQRRRCRASWVPVRAGSARAARGPAPRSSGPRLAADAGRAPGQRHRTRSSAPRGTGTSPWGGARAAYRRRHPQAPVGRWGSAARRGRRAQAAADRQRPRGVLAPHPTPRAATGGTPRLANRPRHGVRRRPRRRRRGASAGGSAGGAAHSPVRSRRRITRGGRRLDLHRSTAMNAGLFVSAQRLSRDPLATALARYARPTPGSGCSTTRAHR